MSRPTSLRLPDTTIDRLESRARRSQLPPRTLAQRYIEEGLRMDEHPLVHFVDGPAGRRPALVGGLDVWEVVEVVRDNDSDLANAGRYLGLATSLVEAAFRYYAAHRDEIDGWIAANRAEVDEAHRTWLAVEAALAE